MRGTEREKKTDKHTERNKGMNLEVVNNILRISIPVSWLVILAVVLMILLLLRRGGSSKPPARK